MTIINRKDSKYLWIDITTPDGRRIRKSTETSNKKLAQEFHDIEKAKSWTKNNQTHINRTWDEATEKYLNARQGIPTFKLIKWEISLLNPYLSKMYLNDIDENIVSAITEVRKNDYNKLYKNSTKKVSNDTVNHTLSILSAVLYFAMDELEWIKQVPEIPLLPKEKRNSWLTPSEAQRLLEELPEDLNGKVRFSLATGLRQSNVLNLQWEHVDLQNKIAIVNFYDSKNEHPFNVPLNDWAMQVLQKQRGKHPTHVFSYNGKPLKKIQYNIWRKALDRAGICPFYSSSCNRYNDYLTKPLNADVSPRIY